MFLGELSKIIYEHFSKCFILKDPSSGFSKLFQVVIARCFFNLLFFPLSYNFKGCFKSIHPHINLEYRPLEVVKPSLLASKPSLIYTLIGSWCRSMSKFFLISFFELLFFKSYVMLRGFWRTLLPLPNYFMVLIFFTTNMDDMLRMSPLLSHLQARGKVTP